ncbi:MAG: hypothetical protein CM15mP102_05030 [Flavobacteriales bacterium]|nr:MAG: hypothetical protein CM15mP102_05030 [Flavobacteriales bacterium]
MVSFDYMRKEVRLIINFIQVETLIKILLSLKKVNDVVIRNLFNQ